jgi:hypothetical protein
MDIMPITNEELGALSAERDLKNREYRDIRADRDLAKGVKTEQWNRHQERVAASMQEYEPYLHRFDDLTNKTREVWREYRDLDARILQELQERRGASPGRQPPHTDDPQVVAERLRRGIITEDEIPAEMHEAVFELTAPRSHTEQLAEFRFGDEA